jgi:isopenicillin-N N-acyltransferase-like protein
MKANKFPVMTLRGDSHEIGYQHGRFLKERIHSTVKWYRMIIGREENELNGIIDHFKSIINGKYPHYGEEIEAIAEGAEIDSKWIYMLNSRSEIMTTFRNECTALYFRKSAILGQNWDWAEELENLAVILKIYQNDKPQIIMMTEPGIIGKIGFNSAGIGACLNFLDSGKPCKNTVPVHILLRAILETNSIYNVQDILNAALMGKSANILVGDSSGAFIDVEFANEEVYYPSTEEDVFIHTNHYFENQKLNSDLEKLASSFARYETATNLAKNVSHGSIEEMKAILLNSSRKDLPICRPYVEDPDLGNVGTICSLIMDLKKLQMHITLGNPFVTPFSVLTLES